MRRSHVLPFSLALLGAVLAAGRGVGVSWAASKPATLKKAPMSDDPNELYAQAAVLVLQGEPDAAEKIAKAALEKHGEAHGFHLILGDVLSRRQRYADAFYEWQWEFLRAGPGSTTGDLAVKRIGDLLADKRGTDVDEARLVLDAVMLTVKDPKAAYAILEKTQNDRGSRFALREYMAEAKQRQGDVTAAIELYRDLLREDPYFVPGYVQLAVLLQSTGKDAESTEMILKARSIDPDSWRLKDL